MRKIEIKNKITQKNKKFYELSFIKQIKKSKQGPS